MNDYTVYLGTPPPPNTYDSEWGHRVRLVYACIEAEKALAFARDLKAIQARHALEESIEAEMGHTRHTPAPKDWKVYQQMLIDRAWTRTEQAEKALKADLGLPAGVELEQALELER